MTANINPDTGIAYGYISANSLHPDIIQGLQDNGTDMYYEDAVKEAQTETAQDLVQRACRLLETELSLSLDEDALFEIVHEHVKGAWEGSRWEEQFNDAYQPDEPIHEGEKDGVKYRTSWLGGALNVWVFESPHTGRFRECSPCVPNAANLDQPDEDGIEGYDVPPEWRDDGQD